MTFMSTSTLTPPAGARPAPVSDHAYPLTFSVDYPDRKLSRVSTFFRAILVVPIGILLATIDGGVFSALAEKPEADFVGAGFGLLVLPILLMLLFRKKYPRWWYDWNLEMIRFINRIYAYILLMDDRYPSTDDHQSVHLDFPYPDADNDLNRALPLFKWLLAIPHYVALYVLTLMAFVATIFAWFAILLTGRYPRSLFRFNEGVLRWSNRVVAYAYLLVTDRYPPFSLRA